MFVGRERELERLRGAFDEAFAGRGSVVMLVGEPGIGKTRTTQELETYARMRGAQVLWGRANEAAGAPPYWPWVQVGARLPRAERRRGAPHASTSPYAVELQRIFPRCATLFPNLPEPPAADSEEGAVPAVRRDVGVPARASSERDADRWSCWTTCTGPTARRCSCSRTWRARLGRARMLVLGTYRDTDLDRRAPALAGARRA